MKKPGKIPKLSKKAHSTANSSDSQPQTAEEYLEEGTVQEESGDRWFGSDITKSLRFYQKAYNCYITAIKCSPTILDGYYNASRLLFHVYNQYIKQDGVNVFQLQNVPEALCGDSSAVVQSLDKIIEAHERAASIAQKSSISIPLDLTYNTALVYSEVIETEENLPFDQMLQLAIKIKTLFEDVLKRQVAELGSFVDELQLLNRGEEMEFTDSGEVNLEDVSDSRYENVEEAIMPSTVLETILSSYRFIQTVFEAVSTSNQLNQTQNAFTGFISECDQYAIKLINEFGPASIVKIESVPHISDEQLNELKIAKNCVIGLQTDDFKKICEIWNSSELPHIAERYMAAADNIQTLIDKYNDTQTEISPDLSWQYLTNMNKYYKLGQDLLNTRYQSSKLAKLDNLGHLISQITSLIIARSDTDLQRCQLPTQSAIANKEILFKNCKVLLKNAMNLANTSGGLRESMTEKLLRERQKVEAVLRLCFLEGKNTVEDLDNILGRDIWTNELPNLISLGIFDDFGINELKQFISL